MAEPLEHLSTELDVRRRSPSFSVVLILIVVLSSCCAFVLGVRKLHRLSYVRFQIAHDGLAARIFPSKVESLLPFSSFFSFLEQMPLEELKSGPVIGKVDKTL